ncbi:MAG: histidine kinase [Bacteroidota bacterium]
MQDFRLKKSDFRLLIAYFTASILWLTYRYIVEGYTTFEIVTGLIGVVIKVSVLIYIFMWLIQMVLVEKKNHFVFLVLACLALLVIGYLDLLRDYYTASPPWRWNLSTSEVIVRCFYNSAPDLALPLGFLLGKRYYENQINLLALERTQREMQLKVLRAQYDPHFLYNNLNTIDALIEHSPKQKVKKYVSHLASLYRYLIQNKEEDLMTVESEIEMAKNYFYLIETRFEKDYHFSIQIKEMPKNKFLPNGSLLTVLENVIKHNQPTAMAVTTVITVNRHEIVITNNKTKTRPQNERFGTGLKNLESQYTLLSDSTLTILNEKENFTIILPLLKIVD